MSRWALTLVAALAAGAAWAQAVEIPLVQNDEFKDPEHYYPGGLAMIELSAAPPQGVKTPALPAGTLYGEIALGEKRYPLAICKGKGGAYTRLLLDSNADADLTDEKDYAESSGGEIMTWDAARTSKSADKEFPFKFALTLYTNQISMPLPASGKAGTLYLGTATHFEGDLELQGKKYLVIIADTNANGVFGETPGKPTSGDRGIAYDGDNLLLVPAGTQEPVNQLVFPNLLWLKGVLYEVALKFSEGKLVLTPTAQSTQAMALPVDTEQINLLDADKKLAVACDRPGKEIKVPAGNYTLIKYQLRCADDGGNNWLLVANATEKTPKLAPGAKNVYGIPYRPIVAAEPSPEGGWSLAMNLTGAGGEIVCGLQCLGTAKSKIAMSPDPKYKGLPTQPIYRVVTAEGEVEGEGAFEYG